MNPFMSARRAVRAWRSPVNILHGLFGRSDDAHVLVSYRFDDSNPQSFELDETTYEAFTHVIEQMQQRNSGFVSVGITPRDARGRRFTTGNDELDQIVGDELYSIQTGREFGADAIRVVKVAGIQFLQLDDVTLAIRSEHNGQFSRSHAPVSRLSITDTGNVIVTFPTND